MPRLFLSYRREDSLDIAGRIYDRLVAHFGDGSVFMDVDSIPFGVDFRAYLSGWVASCDALLAVIGNHWLDAQFESGPNQDRRRLDDPADFVRIEITAALARQIPVIPVLVGGAGVPRPDQLPADLEGLAFRNAAEVGSGRDFHGHMQRLISGLERVLAAGPAGKAAPDPPADAHRARPRPARPAQAPAGGLPAAPAVAWPTNLGFEGPEVGGVPAGWFNSHGVVGGVSTAYEIKVVPREATADGRCLRIRRAEAGAQEFGSVMQRCPAERFLGKQIRFEGELRTEALETWAGLWLRIDGPSGHLFFDNMHDRPIRGTTPWSRYAIETRVPEGSVWINYGILLVRNGTVLADNLSLTVVEAAAQRP